MKQMFSVAKSISTAVLFVTKRNIVESIYPKLEIKKQNFANFILNKMGQHPDQIAMIDGLSGQKYSYKELVDRINSIASALTTRGLKKGDKVGMLAANSVDYISVYVATIGCGATIVAFNPSYTKYELEPLMSMTKPKFLFSSAAPLKNILPSMDTTFVEKMFNMDPEPIPGIVSTKCLLEEGYSHSPINDESYKTPDDVSVIIFSSGTTGHPKGVPLTNSNLIAASMLLDSVRSVANHNVLISILPMFHIYGVIVALVLVINSGSTSVILPSFNPTTFLQSIEKYKISHMHLVPPMLFCLLNNEDTKNYNLSSVLRITSGAASIDPINAKKITNLFSSFNPNFILGQGYGLSESTGIITIRPSTTEISKNKSGSVGLLLPNQELKIMSTDTGEEVGPNVLGEIMVKGPNIITGYYGMAADINASFFSNGWFRTGDLGYYDDDQYLFIVDRIKELIKVKGFQVAPAELEALLLSHPSIKDCAVVGVAHNRFGEVPKAFVVKSQEISEYEVKRFVEENLTSYKHLNGGVKFVDSIPKSASGKILRRLLKEG